MAKRERKENLFDYNLIFVILFISLFGLVMIYSASFFTAQLKFQDSLYFVKRQAAWLLLGLAAMVFMSFFKYQWITKLWGLGWVFSMGLMIATNFTPLGVERNGSKRWIGIAGRPLFQSAEVVKIALIIVMAVLCTKMMRYLATRRARIVIYFFSLPLFVLVAMNNLSSGIIIAGIVASMYFISSRDRKLFLIVAVGVIAVYIFARFFTDQFINLGLLSEYRLKRILVWTHPEAFPKDGGYQVLQGLYAVGSGGFLGKGLGRSAQKFFLPESQNDMIFAIICEELGLFGAVCLILIFLFLLYRMVLIAYNAPDYTGSMLVTGIMSQIAIQLFLNIAVVTGFFPNTGVSLPFVSYGGTSLLFLMVEMGIVLNVSRQITFDDGVMAADGSMNH